ncbi:MAG: DMT family transporter [bacterium]|nr:DMT family transporter [bacterium]
MPDYTAIIFALIALLSWGLAEFYIQKLSRIIGVWKVLFSVGVMGFIFLLPFIKNEIVALDAGGIIQLTILGMVIFSASFFNFAALKKGKISIVEPLIGMELPLTVALSVGLGRESLTIIQSLLIVVIFIGLLMVITMHHKHLHQTRKTIEKGVMLAVAGAICLALTNFLVGVSSRQISPLMVIWFAHTELAIICAFYLMYIKKFHAMIVDLKSHLKATMAQSLLYNLGWLAFAFATTTIATSIVTAISESYIILGVILGIFVNREKLKRHQIVGLIIAIGGILVLSILMAS